VRLVADRGAGALDLLGGFLGVLLGARGEDDVGAAGAIARPMPREAPVTMAVRPFSMGMKGLVMS
jgi:hypothetical protein